MNLERFQATVDRFTDLKKTLAFPGHDSTGTSPQVPRRAEQMGAKREAGRKPAGKPGELTTVVFLLGNGTSWLLIFVCIR